MKAGGAIKNGGEGEKLKMQFEAKKGGMQSRVMAGENGEETRAEWRNPPAAMEAEGAAEESGSAEMMDAVPMALVEGAVLSHHRDMGGQSRGDGGVQEASGEGLVRTSCEEKNFLRTELVGNELSGNQRSQEVMEKSNGLAIKVDETLSPFRPKGKERLNEVKDSGLVIKEAEDLKEDCGLVIKEGLSRMRDRQPQSPGRLNRRVVRDKMKNMARGKGKNQNMEESVQAREVSRKRKVNDDKLFAFDDRVLNRFCEEKCGEGVNSFSETAVTAE